jgi:hypothetical protein
MHEKVLKIIRIVAAEFKTVDDDTVDCWIELTAPLVSRKMFGKLHSQALALRTAHRMKLAGVGVEDDPLSDIGSIGAGNLMRVAAFSEGETSINFNTNTAQYAEVDADLALTEYGVQYLCIRRAAIMPIRSAGEGRHGWLRQTNQSG